MNEYFWGKWRIFMLVIMISSKTGKNLAPCVPANETVGKDQTQMFSLPYLTGKASPSSGVSYLR